jgi:hypothetical protein
MPCARRILSPSVPNRRGEAFFSEPEGEHRQSKLDGQAAMSGPSSLHLALRTSFSILISGRPFLHKKPLLIARFLGDHPLPQCFWATP